MARAGIDLGHLRRAFSQRRRAGQIATDASLRPAAVLVLAFPDGDDACVVLIRRSTLVGSHRGEFAFPGGALDPGETPRQAALREAYEEIGVVPASIEIVGELDAIVARDSGFHIVAGGRC